ncbi:MAG: LysR family transcriptional regulator [Cyanobacteria bacterium J06597_16]
MNIFHLEVLAAIAEYGTFSDAAIHLEVSQSAVSRAVASVEAELGLPLLVRGRFGAKLTPVGERVMVHAQKMLDIKECIDYEVNLEKGLYHSRLRISSFRSAATHLLPANIARFCKHFPHVEVTLVELDPAGVEHSLREGQTDIGLIPLPRSEDFSTLEIAQDEYVILLPKTETIPPKDLSWEDLAGYSFILFNYAECSSAVRNHWAKWDQPFKVAYVIKEDSTIVSMVAQGLGAAVLPRLAALPIPEGVYVRSLPIRLSRSIGAATLASTPPAPAAKMFLDLLSNRGRFAV